MKNSAMIFPIIFISVLTIGLASVRAQNTSITEPPAVTKPASRLNDVDVGENTGNIPDIMKNKVAPSFGSMPAGLRGSGMTGANTRDAIDKFKQANTEEMQKQMEEFRQRMEKMRDGRNASLEAKRKEFQEEMQKMRDTRKKRALENIDTKMTDLNTKFTKNMLTGLEKLTEILADLESKAHELKTAEVDTVAVDKAIVHAKAVIEEAKLPILDQASKDYVITMTGEDLLKVNAGATIQEMQKDLQALRTKILEVKKSVSEAARQLKTIRNKTPTITLIPSVTISPTIDITQ